MYNIDFSPISVCVSIKTFSNYVYLILLIFLFSNNSLPNIDDNPECDIVTPVPSTREGCFNKCKFNNITASVSALCIQNLTCVTVGVCGPSNQVCQLTTDVETLLKEYNDGTNPELDNLIDQGLDLAGTLLDGTTNTILDLVNNNRAQFISLLELSCTDQFGTNQNNTVLSTQAEECNNKSYNDCLNNGCYWYTDQDNRQNCLAKADFAQFDSCFLLDKYYNIEEYLETFQENYTCTYLDNGNEVSGRLSYLAVLNNNTTTCADAYVQLGQCPVGCFYKKIVNNNNGITVQELKCDNLCVPGKFLYSRYNFEQTTCIDGDLDSEDYDTIDCDSNSNFDKCIVCTDTYGDVIKRILPYFPTTLNRYESAMNYTNCAYNFVADKNQLISFYDIDDSYTNSNVFTDYIENNNYFNLEEEDSLYSNFFTEDYFNVGNSAIGDEYHIQVIQYYMNILNNILTGMNDKAIILDNTPQGRSGLYDLVYSIKKLSKFLTELSPLYSNSTEADMTNESLTFKTLNNVNIYDDTMKLKIDYSLDTRTPSSTYTYSLLNLNFINKYDQEDNFSKGQYYIFNTYGYNYVDEVNFEPTFTAKFYPKYWSKKDYTLLKCYFNNLDHENDILGLKKLNKCDIKRNGFGSFVDEKETMNTNSSTRVVIWIGSLCVIAFCCWRVYFWCTNVYNEKDQAQEDRDYGEINRRNYNLRVEDEREESSDSDSFSDEHDNAKTKTNKNNSEGEGDDDSDSDSDGKSGYVQGSKRPDKLEKESDYNMLCSDKKYTIDHHTDKNSDKSKSSYKNERI